MIDKASFSELANVSASDLRNEVFSSATPLSLSPEDGAHEITSRAHFETFSHRDDVPGALGVREVKYLIAGVDTESPTLYFLNTKKHKYHYFFARDVLGSPLSGREFNSVTYFTENRKFLAGTLIAHDQYTAADGKIGLYAIEFWPTDPVGVNFIGLAFSLIRNGLSFAKEQLVYHPSGLSQEKIYQDNLATFEQKQIKVVTTDDIFENLSYSPLNLGLGFGRLKIMDGGATQPPGITTVVLFKTLPNDLSHVSGVLTETPQTPLSHVNLRAKQNDTPNAYLRNATQDKRIVALTDQLVRYEVKPDDIDIREATQSEVDTFFEEQRPTEPQHPLRDLGETQIRKLDELGHHDLDKVGAKAANVAELRKILASTYVPYGHAVPFYFYHRFMEENGLYDSVYALRELNEFNTVDDVRDKKLKALRKKIRKAPVPDELRAHLNDVHQAMDATKPLRCRSSTNNEDLEGFNGAGLYDSFTHRPDEGHLEKSIKQVWASLWNFRAYEEREFYRIDHFETAMGVLLHRNYDDELANGVALTKNIYFPDFSGFYVNTQVGEALTTNPDPNAIAEELLVMIDAASPGQNIYETIRIRESNLIPSGEMVMSDAHVDELIEQMEIIQSHFKVVYNAQADNSFAMDLEFKVDKDGHLSIKQARPWVD